MKWLLYRHLGVREGHLGALNTPVKMRVASFHHHCSSLRGLSGQLVLPASPAGKRPLPTPCKRRPRGEKQQHCPSLPPGVVSQRPAGRMSSPSHYGNKEAPSPYWMSVETEFNRDSHLRRTMWVFSPIKLLGFFGGSVVKNLPAGVGDVGSIPDPGRSPMPWSNQAHAPQLLSLCSRAWESQRRRPMHPRICALQQGSHWNKKASSAAREHLHSPPLEKSPTQQWRHSTHKVNK